MNAGTLLILAALAASLLLLVRTRSRLWPAIATAASALMALFALGLVSFAVKGVPLGLLLAATLTAAGVMAWLGSGGKLPVTAATVVIVVGAAQLLSAVL
ncbi:MAG TPA: hypothetical protein VGB85_06175 [Nannocystis sp.]|jgi:hypothetical protein